MCVVFGVCCVSIGGTVEAPSGAGSPPLSITGQKPALVSQSGQTFKSRTDTHKIHKYKNRKACRKQILIYLSN